MSREGSHSVLTKKEVEVLEFVFLHWWEAEVVVNPAQIEKGMHGRLSRAYAAKVCERLEARGILESVPIRPRRKKDPTKHYRLRKGPDALVALTRIYFHTLAKRHSTDWPYFARTLLSSGYVRGTHDAFSRKRERGEVESDFVRHVLATRNVEMRYMVTPEGRRFWDLPENERVDWSGRRQGELIGVGFPIVAPGATHGDTVGRVHALRNGTAGLRPDVLNDVAERHYTVVEEDSLVLPILALLRLSPRALLEFAGDWEPHEIYGADASCRGYEMVEHVLFRMVFAAIADLAMFRDVPGVDVTFGAVRPERSSAPGRTPALLELTWRDERVIGYDAGFDTDELWVAVSDEDVVQVTRNPENAWVRIWTAELPPVPSGHETADSHTSST